MMGRLAFVAVVIWSGSVEADATAELRASKRAPVRMFHRGEYFGPLIEKRG